MVGEHPQLVGERRATGYFAYVCSGCGRLSVFSRRAWSVRPTRGLPGESDRVDQIAETLQLFKAMGRLPDHQLEVLMLCRLCGLVTSSRPRRPQPARTVRPAAGPEHTSRRHRWDERGVCPTGGGLCRVLALCQDPACVRTRGPRRAGPC
ncbi:hypothetical protein GCM10010350_84040 [Streptomyces galilaeus]|nr:hypothetical protein GCM10010350_84040 [Streptomyces galilaeus]